MPEWAASRNARCHETRSQAAVSGGILPFSKRPLASSTAACAGKLSTTDETPVTWTERVPGAGQPPAGAAEAGGVRYTFADLAAHFERRR
jgi:hypothetical protein